MELRKRFKEKKKEVFKMRKTGIYAMFDKEDKIFNKPIISDNDRQMERDIYFFMKNGEGAFLYEFAEDFILYKLGEIDEQGKYTEKREAMIELIDVKRRINYEKKEEHERSAEAK